MLCVAIELATSFARGHISFYLSESIEDRRPGADNELLYSGVALPPLPSACIPLQPSGAHSNPESYKPFAILTPSLPTSVFHKQLDTTYTNDLQFNFYNAYFFITTQTFSNYCLGRFWKICQTLKKDKLRIKFYKHKTSKSSGRPK